VLLESDVVELRGHRRSTTFPLSFLISSAYLSLPPVLLRRKGFIDRIPYLEHISRIKISSRNRKIPRLRGTATITCVLMFRISS